MAGCSGGDAQPAASPSSPIAIPHPIRIAMGRWWLERPLEA
jgi:hypothetical protein